MLKILFRFWFFVRYLFWRTMQYFHPLPLACPGKNERQKLLPKQHSKSGCPIAAEVSICDIWNTTRTQTFAKQLQMFLKTEMISVKRTYRQETASKSIPCVVLCLRQSRLMPDVAYSLTDVEEKCYRHIILVLMHFKADDKIEQAVDLQKSSRVYLNMTILDCFLQETLSNIGEMNKRILEAILTIGFQQQKMHTKH
ncbi:uncharacterized protein LOC128552161 isoform X2 [Mercenaria mercenaria]|uniref:uncharacterized protein LOC128552161 isoform X2 n=1 Tax=Mercenaria mercenaria TaxID=6596 RepID=UPI00234F2C12|nr:uncharacterized protein LOC128552161 isoform X2 [Mercenaria mercenaria]